MLSVLLDPGLLRSELVLQAATPVPDGLGGYSDVWIEWAALRHDRACGRQQHHSRRSDARDGDTPDHHPQKGRYPQRHAPKAQEFQRLGPGKAFAYQGLAALIVFLQVP